MTPTARQILALWQDHPHRSASQSDIQRSLKARGAEVHHIRTALRELVQKGQLVRQGERYRLSPVAAPREGASGAPGAADRSAPRQKFRDAMPPAAPDTPRMAGTFTAHPDGYGFVWIGDLRDSLFIPPRENLGALDGDWVAVETVPSRGHRTSGRITAVVERRRLRARGRIELDRGRTWVVPLNQRVPDILIEPLPGDAAYRPGDLVDVEITEFPRDADEAPGGRIAGRAEEGDSPDHFIDTILANSTLHQGFSAETRAQMRDIAGGDVTIQARAEGRTDLTGLFFVTIDPENARDFDDAVYLDRAPGGRDRLWVAIADVAAYIPAESPLDEDAYAKGTSVYFPARVLPMLPELLSNDLCSLRPNEPRLAMVVEMELDGEGEAVVVNFHEAVIRSRARLTYEQAQGVFDGLPGAEQGVPDAGLRSMLVQMKRVAERLRRKRDRRGAVSFVFPEVRFELDGAGMPARILRKYPSDATRLIEQFMLEANECVAAHCAEQGLPALYRVHDPPPEDTLPQVAAQLWNSRVKASLSALRSPRGFNAVVAELAHHPEREALELVLLKAMSQAQYREKSEPHFALAAEHYCHFTSPIRRYPDLVVHRALKAWIHRDRGLSLKPVRPDEGLHLSARERTAADVEQQVARLYRVLYLEPHVGEEYPATVTSVSERGIAIGLRDEFVEGFMPLDALADDHYRFDRDRQVLVARNRRQTVAFGQRLTAQLAKADRWTQRLEFVVKRWSWEPPRAAAEKPTGKPTPPHREARVHGKGQRKPSRTAPSAHAHKAPSGHGPHAKGGGKKKRPR